MKWYHVLTLNPFRKYLPHTGKHILRTFTCVWQMPFATRAICVSLLTWSFYGNVSNGFTGKSAGITCICRNNQKESPDFFWSIMTCLIKLWRKIQKKHDNVIMIYYLHMPSYFWGIYWISILLLFCTINSMDLYYKFNTFSAMFLFNNRLYRFLYRTHVKYYYFSTVYNSTHAVLP